ncbi:MAG: monovalent cation/H(+) antiporter subunit G [Clostridia bacterium]|nr:monovalent cation/H(+) antiporter subunit G [Clostridia bacterium]
MVRDIIGLVLIGLGMFMILTAIVGVFKFRYVLNRMHASALCDTLGLLLVIAGLIVILGINAQSLKMMLITVFMWLASPVMSHLIARAEVMTHAHIKDECEEINQCQSK